MSLSGTYQFRKSEENYLTSLCLSTLSIHRELEKLYTRKVRQGMLITINKNFEL